MEKTNMVAKQDGFPIPRRGTVKDRPSVIYRLLVGTLLCVTIFSLTHAVMIRPYIASLVAALMPLQSTLCSAEVPQGKLPAFESNGKLWPSQKYRTEDFRAPDMLVNKTGETEDGFLFIEPWGRGTKAVGPAIMTEENDLIWHGPVGDTTNLNVQSLHGNPVLTYWHGTSTATFGHGYGYVTILDRTYTEIGRVCAHDLGIVTPDGNKYDCYVDMHESYLTDNGTLIFTAYNVTQYDLRPIGGPKDGWVFDSQFYEVDFKTSKILFKWSSLAHIDEIPLTMTREPLNYSSYKFGYTKESPLDYFHINSVQPMRDGWLVNGRHVFSFFKLNRKGNVEWHLQGETGGDFEKPTDLRFSWQHHPRLVSERGSEVTLHLFNNDNSEFDYKSHETTGLEMTLDSRSKKATLDRRLVQPSDPIYAASQGSYQSLANGHVLMGYGQIAKVKEFNALGEVVYTAEFGASTYELQVASYRAYRFLWKATPKADPKVAAETSGKLMNVFASWNGATDVDHWTVYAGDSKDDLKKVRTVRKSGFETVVPLKGTAKYVQVEAKKGSTSLRKSEVVKVRKLDD